MTDDQFQKVIMEWKIAMSEEQCRHAKETRRINEELEHALLALTEKNKIGSVGDRLDTDLRSGRGLYTSINMARAKVGIAPLTT